jgi:hypothetical protein
MSAAVSKRTGLFSPRDRQKIRHLSSIRGAFASSKEMGAPASVAEGSPAMTTRDTERLEMALSDAKEIFDFVAHVRKFHAHEPNYMEWADFLEDATKTFRGSFDHIRHALDDAEQSDAHAEMMADIDWHNGRV